MLEAYNGREMQTVDDLTGAAMRKGFESFEATFGRVPDNFRLMAEHAPETFAGYSLMRAGVMRDRDEGGALDRKTKELIFALLDTLAGQTAGARAHRDGGDEARAHAGRTRRGGSRR